MREILHTALEAAQAATAVHLRYRSVPEDRQAREKGRSDFVSQVDLEAQRAALTVIGRRFPDHAVVAEEEDGEAGVPDGIPQGTGADPAAGRHRGVPVWVVDPLDGTTNYLHGHPQYAASVGVLLGGEPVVGAVTAGATGERWWARKDGGAWKDGRRIQVSGVRVLQEALVGTGYPFKRLDLLPDYLDQFGRVLPGTVGIRRGGSAALDLCALASGTLDAFWELILSPWDVAAGAAILQEAGGRLARVDGSPMGYAESGSVLAANSSVLLEGLGALVRGE